MALPRLGSGDRFRSLANKLSRNPKISNPAAVASSIGRKKYGSSKFSKLSAMGRKKR